MKVFFVVSAFFILFAAAPALADNSGIKLAVDWTNLNLLKKINYSKLFSNKTLLTDGIGAGNGGFFGYKVNISNINVASVFPPQAADIIPSGVDSNTPSVSINLKNFNATLNADYQLSVSIYADSKKQSKIELVINELSVDLSINKTTGETTVKKCLLDIKSLEIAFNGYLVRSVYWLLKYKAISAIKSNVEALSSLLSNIINTSNKFPILLNIDGNKIIGLNLTIVDRPDLIFYNSTQSRTVQIQSPVKFLNKDLVTAQNITTSVFQSVGIKGAIYPFSQPAQNYTFPPPVEMKFDPLYLRNKVVLLLSDYTLNTVFNIAQQSGNVFTNINNDTTGLPFTVDTKGLGLILPELTQFFAPNNYVCNIKVGVMGIHRQPVISTLDDGSSLSLNFGMFIDVHNETSIEEEPFNAVNLNLDFNVKLKLSIDEDKLSILIGQISANNVIADSHIGAIDTEKSKKTLESLVKVAVTQFSGDLRKINIVEKLYNLTGLNFYDFVIDANPGHHAITFNYRDN